MNPQTTVSPAAPGRPSSGMPAVFFFLPLVGIAISFASNICSTFQSALVPVGSDVGLFLMLAVSIPIFIGAMLIGLAGMKDWRLIGVLLLGVSALMLSGYSLLDLLVQPRVEIQTYNGIILVFNAVLDLQGLVGSILLIVNRKGGSPLVRVGGLLFLFKIIFTWVFILVISMLNETIARVLEIDITDYYQDYYRYIMFGRTLIIQLLNTIAWILLAIGVIRERSAARA